MFKLLSVSCIEYLYLFFIFTLSILQRSGRCVARIVMHRWRDKVGGGTTYSMFQLSPQKKPRKGRVIPLNLEATLWNPDTWLFGPGVSLTKYCFTGAVLYASALCRIMNLFSFHYIFVTSLFWKSEQIYVCFKSSVFSFHIHKLSFRTK